MVAYSIDYEVGNKRYSTSVDAKDLKSAKKKIARKHGFINPRKIRVMKLGIIGYF